MMTQHKKKNRRAVEGKAVSEGKTSVNKVSISKAIEQGTFKGLDAKRLRFLQMHLPMKRKDAEQYSSVPYLPSFAQKVNPKLTSVCGLYIDSAPLGDGSRRKIYFFKGGHQ